MHKAQENKTLKKKWSRNGFRAPLFVSVNMCIHINHYCTLIFDLVWNQQVDRGWGLWPMSYFFWRIGDIDFHWFWISKYGIERKLLISINKVLRKTVLWCNFVLNTVYFSLLGPCKGGPGILDSNFKQTADSRFKFQNGRILDSKFKLDKIQDSKFVIFLGFKFQTTLPGFIFQTCRDSGFKFEIDGIQDSYLGLQGPF